MFHFLYYLKWNNHNKIQKQILLLIQEIFSKGISSALQSQNYQSLTKQKEKLQQFFPPDDTSLYSGKTDFSIMEYQSSRNL